MLETNWVGEDNPFGVRIYAKSWGWAVEWENNTRERRFDNFADAERYAGEVIAFAHLAKAVG